jgi:hypothetical protein
MKGASLDEKGKKQIGSDTRKKKNRERETVRGRPISSGEAHD